MKTLLLIEDDRIMRENTAEILRLAEFEVVTAENGKIGTQLAKKVRPDIIICDIMMPELDGYGVLHILSKDPATAGIPFIFLTAKTERSEIRKGMDLGADDYLIKPFEDTELLNAIESRLKKNQIVRGDYSNNVQGLNRFIDAASQIKELNSLSHNRPLVTYRKKEMIYHEGETPQFLFFLNRGKVKIHKLHDDGKDYIVDMPKSGEFFGFISLLEGTPYTDSATAVEECEICKIPKEDFLPLVLKNRDIAVKFIRMLSNNIQEKEKQLLSLAYDTVRKRVAEALLQLGRDQGVSKAGPSRINITREDLAGLAGTAPETVIRSLSEFKADRLIAVEGREILILDSHGLKEIK